MASQNKLKKKLKRQKQYLALEQKRFWHFELFWQIILDTDPTFCFLCGKYIAPYLRTQSVIKKPYKKGDVCHESCWKEMMQMEDITKRVNEFSRLICHMDLGWGVDSKVCRMRVRNNAESIMIHLIDHHDWKLIPELKEKEFDDEMKILADSKISDKGFSKKRDSQYKDLFQNYKENPEKWFNDNQLIWLDYRSIHFLKPNGKSFPEVKDY